MLCSNLRVILEIRNILAHSHFAVGFGYPDIIAQCEKLKFPEVETAPGSVRPADNALAQFASNPRTKFCIIAAMAASRLIGDAITVERRARKEDPKIIGGASI
jgi:hypothetical protein